MNESELAAAEAALKQRVLPAIVAMLPKPAVHAPALAHPGTRGSTQKILVFVLFVMLTVGIIVLVVTRSAKVSSGVSIESGDPVELDYVGCVHRGDDGLAIKALELSTVAANTPLTKAVGCMAVVAVKGQRHWEASCRDQQTCRLDVGANETPGN